MDDNQEKAMWDRFIKLGERIGDGDLDASESRWMNREYAKLMKVLIPEIKEQEREKRAIKNKRIDEKLGALLETKKCKCGGKFKQSRSGSLIVYCGSCNSRAKAVVSKTPCR